MDAAELAAFAERLVAERRKQFPTRLALAKEAKISRTTLRMLERGQQEPTQETIEKLSIALGLPQAILKGEKSIAADDPLLKDLRPEDLEIAQLFHHASTDAKVKARDGLRADAHRADGAPSVGPVIERRTGEDRRAIASNTSRRSPATVPPTDTQQPDAPTEQLLERMRRRIRLDPAFADVTKEDLDLFDARTTPTTKTPAHKKTQAAPPRKA